MVPAAKRKPKKRKKSFMNEPSRLASGSRDSSLPPASRPPKLIGFS
jgi:hypothetical protein